MTIGDWSTFHTPYNETEVRKYVPTNGGVYLLWVYYKSGRWECFYVGKAENLEDRLLAHLSPNDPDKCIRENVKYKCGFHWLEVSTAKERAAIEKYLYDRLKPECNNIDPGGSAIQVPIPNAS